jgi:GT2 family glycosyltransferase
VYIVKGNGNLWYTRCINEGLKFACTLNVNYVITLNDDVYFDKNYISLFIEFALDQKADFLVGSSSFTISKPHRVTFSGVKAVNPVTLKETNYFAKFSELDPTSIDGLRPSVNLSGRGLFFPFSMLNRLGFLDERFPQYGSDTDFSYRAHKIGIPVFVSYDSKIFEYEQLTSKGAAYNKPSIKEYFASLFHPYSVNSLKKSMLYYSKHGIKVIIPFYFLYLLIGTLFVFFVKYRRG